MEILKKCLKIGYANDVEERLKTYKTHNPSIKLLKSKEGDIELEHILHKYFKDFLLPNEREWFIYSDEIIDKFDLIEGNEWSINFLDLDK